MATAPSTFEPGPDSFVATDTYEVGERMSAWEDTWRRLRRNKLALVGMAIIVILVITAIVSSFWTPYDVWRQSLGPTYQGPTGKHPFGLDDSGRDILSRLMGGAQVSMVVGVGTATLSSIIGIMLGLLAGFYRGLGGHPGLAADQRLLRPARPAHRAADRGRDAAAWARQHHPGHLIDGLAGHGPSGARSDLEPARAGVRRGRAFGGHSGPVDPGPPHLPQRPGADHRAGDLRDPGGHPLRGLPELPGVRRQATHAILGPDGG